MKLQITLDTDFPLMASVALDGRKVGYLHKVSLDLQSMEESRQIEQGVVLGPPRMALELVGYKVGAGDGNAPRVILDRDQMVFVTARLDGNPVSAVPQSQVQRLLEVLQNNMDPKKEA